MTHPADPFSYPTFMDAVLAGAEKPTLDRIDDWADNWHDGKTEHAEIHEALGFNLDQYNAIVIQADGTALKAEVEKRRALIAGPSFGPLQIEYGIPASSQMDTFQNATITTLNSGHAISIALTPPADLDVSNREVLETMLKSIARRFIDTGWKIEMKIGPDDENFISD